MTKNFKASEFICHHCGRAGIMPYFVDELQRLRDILGRPIIVTSGYRCPYHPVELAKGARGPGWHCKGVAADITGPPLTAIWTALQAMPKITGVGVAPFQNYVHVDMRPLRQGRAYWSYDRSGREIAWSGEWEELPK